METVTGTEIRDFRVRGNYFNQRTLLHRRGSHSSKRDNIASNSPGYSPPVVEFDLQDGSSGSIVISEADIPLLCGDDFEQGKRHLSLILNARHGDSQAAYDLSAAAQADSFGGTGRASAIRERVRRSLHQLSAPLRAGHQSKGIHTPETEPTGLSCAGLRRAYRARLYETGPALRRAPLGCHPATRDPHDAGPGELQEPSRVCHPLRHRPTTFQESWTPTSTSA